MKTKTCGECKRFTECKWVTPDVIADNCEDFEPKIITNGDKIDRIIKLAKTLHKDLQGVLDIRILRRISDIYATAKEIKERENER